MDSSRDGSRRAPSFTLRLGGQPPVTLDRFGGQPVVLALSSGPLETSWKNEGDPCRGLAEDDSLAAVRAELRGLGAVLLLVFDDGALCLGPEDEVWRIGSGDARDAADRAAMRARYGVPPGATGLFIIDGDRRLRFSYIEVAPRQGTLHTIAAALSATGPVDMSRLILSRRELVVSSLAAAFALALTEPPARAAPAPPAAETAAGEVEIILQINGEARRLRLDPRVTLLDALRERLGLTGTKKGCDQGQCGACTVLIAGRRVNACLTLAVMSEGAPITTIEGLAKGDALHPLQAAFIACDGFQCGYCTSGQIMSAAGLLAEGQARSDDEVREQMSGNICRCGAYPNIVAAIQQARKET
jgi:xanthine dehydrogenase YagT iron-sulfur-binding subunit